MERKLFVLLMQGLRTTPQARRLRDPVIAEIMNRLLASMRVRGKGERTLIIDGVR